MMITATIWLAAMAAGGSWWVWRDIGAYRDFQALTDTADRQRAYFRWLVESFVVLLGASVVSLWLAGGLSPFNGFPDAFQQIHLALQPDTVETSGDNWLPIALGMTSGILVAALAQWWRAKKMLNPAPRPDDALIPRNRREAGLALLLSLNAGFSEEIFFRLALPLLLVHVTGSLPIALAVSVLGFGLAHAHYGWKGMAATMLAGGLLTLYYLSHGSLLRVILAHALIDVVAFFVRPAIVHWLTWRRAPAWATS